MRWPDLRGAILGPQGIAATPSFLAVHLRGHALLFETPPKPAYGAAAGARLLLIFAVLELLLGPRLWLLAKAGIPALAPWIRGPLVLLVALVLIRFAARVPLAELGLRPWRQWTTTERSYFVQVSVVAVALLSWLYASRLGSLGATAASATLAAHLPWGFHQELMYRGVLQRELTRRWGPAFGIVASNSLYAFGPLHFYHFSSLSGGQLALMFGAIFAVGLFFALLFARSGNLWIVGAFHGIGDFYFSGLAR